MRDYRLYEDVEEPNSKQARGNNSKGDKKGAEEAKGGIDFVSLFIFFVCVLLFSYLFVNFVGQRTTVSGSSMESTLSDGDNLMVDKLSYRFKDPERFDIIIFPPRYEEDTLYIKRIIGLPGETVQIDDYGNIFINGSILYENYGKEVINNPGQAKDLIELSEDEYFVLGDNRNNSSDSRAPQVGTIHRSEIVGKAFVRIFPFNKIGILKHG